MELFDIVMKLAGPIHPTGRSEVDEKHLENLLVLLDMMDELMARIGSIAGGNKNRVEHSMKKIGQECARFLDAYDCSDECMHVKSHDKLKARVKELEDHICTGCDIDNECSLCSHANVVGKGKK